MIYATMRDMDRDHPWTKEFKVRHKRGDCMIVQLQSKKWRVYHLAYEQASIAGDEIEMFREAIAIAALTNLRHMPIDTYLVLSTGSEELGRWKIDRVNWDETDVVELMTSVGQLIYQQLDGGEGHEESILSVPDGRDTPEGVD